MRAESLGRENGIEQCQAEAAEIRRYEDRLQAEVCHGPVDRVAAGAFDRRANPI
ncbi:hypothetical protein D9M70_629960 [compost metagenome]